MSENPIKFTDVTFRDGHQSTLATRLRIEDMEPIAAEMDKAGFYSMEVWGGATFDVTTRFLNEDPWEQGAYTEEADAQYPPANASARSKSGGLPQLCR